MKKVKKLSLKKVKVLDFEDASRVIGGTVGEGCPYTTQASDCCTKPGQEDSCTVCLTFEPTCPETCPCPPESI
jgi:natural product precursor